MIYLLLVILLAFIITDILREKKIFSPGFVFNGIFFITIALYVMYLSYVQKYLSFRMVMLLYVAVAFFNIPRVYDVYDDSKIKQPNGVLNIELSKNKEFIACAIAVFMFLVELVYCNGCPLIWKVTGDGRTYFDFGIPTFNGLMNSLVVLMGAYSLFKKDCGYKYVYLFIGFLAVSRQILLSIVVEGAVLYLLRGNKLSKKTIIYGLIGAFVAVLAFSAFGNFRTGKGNFEQVVRFKENVNWLPTAFKWLYSYLCFSLSNMNYLVSQTFGFLNLGASSINEFVPSIIAGFFPVKYGFYYLVSPNFTVSTFMPSLYLDFGYLGIALFCLVVGFLSVYLYKKALKKNKVAILIYMVFVHNIIFIFFINMFFYLPIMGQLLFIPIFFCDWKKILNKLKNLKLKI